MAGAAFAARLVALTPAGRGQCHISASLRNDPRISDRCRARMQNGPDPLAVIERYRESQTLAAAARH